MGFGSAATRFFAELEDDNSREFWEAHRSVFEREVRQPMSALVESLPERYQPFKLYRMNRDLRFTRDKSPYKTAQGALSGSGGADHYLQLGADGLLVAVGAYQLEPDQLTRYRAAVDEPRSGRALERLLGELDASGLDVDHHGRPGLVSAPRGYPKDHPRIELLRQKSVVASRTLDGPALADADGVRDFVAAAFAACEPLVGWLGRHVGRPAERAAPPR